MVLLAIGVFHSAALVPLAPLSDTLDLGAAAGGRSTLGRRFEYGWVRGAGSAAFIFGSMLSGQAVGHFGIAMVVWFSAALLTAAAFAAILVPQLIPAQDVAPSIAAGIHGIGARLPLYRRVVLIAALIMGSHTMHDSFAVIMWGAAGINPATSGLLWSLSVAAEATVFLFIGHPLLDCFGPARRGDARRSRRHSPLGGHGRDHMAPGACRHRASPLAEFALLHLTCMRLLAGCVSRRLAATALTVYGAGAGASATLLTLASGTLYARFGAHGFWAMAALCAAALPLTRMLREPRNIGGAC